MDESCNKTLLSLSLKIRSEVGEDVGIIFADPCFQDLEEIILEKYILNIICSALWPAQLHHQTEVKTENFGLNQEEDCISYQKEDEAGSKSTQEDATGLKSTQDKQFSQHSISTDKPDVSESGLFSPDFNTDLCDLLEDYQDLNESFSQKHLAISSPSSGSLLLQNVQTKTQIETEEKAEEGLVETKEGTRGEIKRNDLKDQNSSLDDIELSDLDGDSRDRLKTKSICGQSPLFSCDNCDKILETCRELKKHKNLHHKGRGFPCDECSDVLSTSQSLKRHIRNVHEVVIKNAKCEKCGKVFKDNDNLRKHMKIHEDAAKSFICQDCGKVYKNSPSLKTHMIIMHEKNFKKTCEECGRSFPNMHNLQVHKEMAHMKGELYMCQVCGKEMIGKNRLRNHMMTHPKGQKFVSCEQCGKEVPETQLRSHVYEAHKMQSYRYPCDFCNKRFATKQHIRVHLRKHTGSKPFQCRACGKYFPFIVSVRKHIRVFHEENYSLVFYDVSRDTNNPYISSTAS